ncbi:hypothetical protein IMY05_C2125000800 [Salix suchowensis]|nr:hypothetical protein IMY05_C2125000800 [Salix suchowensis]
MPNSRSVIMNLLYFLDLTTTLNVAQLWNMIKSQKAIIKAHISFFKALHNKGLIGVKEDAEQEALQHIVAMQTEFRVLTKESLHRDWTRASSFIACAWSSSNRASTSTNTDRTQMEPSQGSTHLETQSGCRASPLVASAQEASMLMTSTCMVSTSILTTPFTFRMTESPSHGITHTGQASSPPEVATAHRTSIDSVMRAFNAHTRKQGCSTSYSP